MHNDLDRRKKSRRDIRWPVAVSTDGGIIEGEAQNISSEGIFITCEEPLHLHEVFSISILPPNHEVIGVSGKLIWSDFYGINGEGKNVCMGVCLLEISDEDRMFLENIADASHL
ncbi:MAG: PilZ domain-containing protein [Thermodesulfobacteriota bacterium]|nr:PilZ domain-containing protein [Thermodesulfobacteriota bacterium]